MLKLFIAWTLLVATLSGAPTPGDALADEPVTLRITWADGTPVEGAAVERRRRVSHATDADGVVVIAEPDAGRWTVRHDDALTTSWDGAASTVVLQRRPRLRLDFMGTDAGWVERYGECLRVTFEPVDDPRDDDPSEGVFRRPAPTYDVCRTQDGRVLAPPHGADDRLTPGDAYRVSASWGTSGEFVLIERWIAREGTVDVPVSMPVLRRDDVVDEPRTPWDVANGWVAIRLPDGVVGDELSVWLARDTARWTARGMRADDVVELPSGAALAVASAGGWITRPAPIHVFAGATQVWVPEWVREAVVEVSVEDGASPITTVRCVPLELDALGPHVGDHGPWARPPAYRVDALLPGRHLVTRFSLRRSTVHLGSAVVDLEAGVTRTVELKTRGVSDFVQVDVQGPTEPAIVTFERGGMPVAAWASHEPGIGVTLEPGRYRVVVQRAGRPVERRVVEFAPGAREVLTLDD